MLGISTNVFRFCSNEARFSSANFASASLFRSIARRVLWRAVRAKRIRHVLPPPRWPSAEEAAASLLFSPIRIGAITLSSRTWVPAMVPWRATEFGYVTPELLEWYGRFAEGRPGAIVVEATGIRDVPSGPLLRIGHDRFISGLADLVEVVRAKSGGETKLSIQIIDF